MGSGAAKTYQFGGDGIEGRQFRDLAQEPLLRRPCGLLDTKFSLRHRVVEELVPEQLAECATRPGAEVTDPDRLDKGQGRRAELG